MIFVEIPAGAVDTDIIGGVHSVRGHLPPSQKPVSREGMEHRLATEAAEAVEAAAPKPPDRAVAVADPTGPRRRHPRQVQPRQLPFPRITP